MVLILRSELKPTIQKRSLKAFIDLAILCALTNQPMTGYGINVLFMNRFGIMVSPSMIYVTLVSLERKGWIKCVRNRNGRVYSLTDRGQEIADNLKDIAEEIRSFTTTLQKLKA
jgi:DNA-binding PadR family transcriptional regulator